MFPPLPDILIFCKSGVEVFIYFIKIVEGSFPILSKKKHSIYFCTIFVKELTKFHRERLDVLAPVNLDLYLFETFPALVS